MTRDILHSSNFFLALALGLSIFTYLWNPLEYPPLKYEDGTYVGRAMHVLTAHNPQEGTLYDHPYFGQLFLAGILWITGYPNSIHVSAEGDVLGSVKMLWLIPRLSIGFLGVIDTFLIYKISERRYNTKVAFIASILFALMPISLLRSIYLESLQLPFLLSSILFAVNATARQTSSNEKKNLSMILLSGIFMGLAIFTKIPVFTMIPLVVFLIFTNNNKNWRMVGLWLIPVVLIPLIWPGYAIAHGELDHWWNRVLWQSHRQSAPGALEADKQMTLANSITKNFLNMPLLLVLGLVGLVFAAIKKEFFLLLWAIPLLIFLYFIGFVSEFHTIPLLPVLCISAARLIEALSNKITYRKVQQVLPFFIISAIAIFGLINVVTLFIESDNDNKFALSAFVTRYLHDNKDENITMISNHLYSWIPKYVFHLGKDYMIPEVDPVHIQDKRVLFVVDGAFRGVMSGNDEIGERLRNLYDMHTKNDTTTVEVGRDKLILPQASSYGVANDMEINLINNEHTWMPIGKVNVSQTDRGLNIFVKTNGTEKVTRNAILQTHLKNLTETPLLLSLEYASKSPEGNDKFSVEIKDNDGQNKRYLKGPLRDTSGNVTNQLFLIPGEIAGKPMEFRLEIIANTPGEHTLTVKRASLIFTVLMYT